MGVAISIKILENSQGRSGIELKIIKGVNKILTKGKVWVIRGRACVEREVKTIHLCLKVIIIELKMKLNNGDPKIGILMMFYWVTEKIDRNQGHVFH